MSTALCPVPSPFQKCLASVLFSLDVKKDWLIINGAVTSSSKVIQNRKRDVLVWFAGKMPSHSALSVW
eukprot:CAMPEP_0177382524 /NCGR_PEP_ID=MMETSP0368-20130122/48642_1 /TAXON_ID=447022 ORGANISM="Scrippsiella hangoei-like, Strain SHHI-4" /NCGR_SAMPLE_ID=MMETSP0368 /ASSEMBLY_ACC=CAM_ASM_000363 /LENGTH=67 /DNA_ID=CAMNT_0018847003 /DNA_START=381 /DNA_END=584 /DNA_ORIENTATION=-